MHKNECDHILEKIKGDLSEYLNCLSKSIIDDLLAVLKNRISNEVRQEIIAGFQKEISEDLRKEMHDLFEEEIKSNKVTLTVKSNQLSIDQDSFSDNNMSGASDNRYSQEKDDLQQIPKREIFYLGAPEKDLTFPENRKSMTIDSKSVFVFELKNDNEAIVTIINNEKTHKKMINAYDTYLRGTVKSSNIFNNEFTLIIVNEPGKAELKDGEWKIKDKIQVTFK